MPDAALLKTLERDGYVVLERLLPPAVVAAMRRALDERLADAPHGRNHFEGERTQRIYSLIGEGKEFARLAEHPAILDLLDALLLPHYLLSASIGITIHKDETPQPLHHDDGYYRVPRPRAAFGYSTIWALDDFTAANGATEMIAGSHKWNEEDAREIFLRKDFLHDKRKLPAALQKQIRPLLMPAGSVVFFAGTLYHRGGRSVSDTPRRAITNQYCEPWVRQLENFFLSIPRAKAAAMSPRLQALIGYEVMSPFMGQMAGRHPRKALLSD